MKKNQGRLCVPRVDAIQERILEEAHSSRYSIHSVFTKMYHELRKVYWWEGMKSVIAQFVGKCSNCQEVKLEHERPVGLDQKIELLECKWEMINLDFITGFPRSHRQHDPIWVIVDKIIKSTHFFPARITYLTEDYAKLYIHVTT